VDHSRVGEQLNLKLYPEDPWDGVSPRVLTRGYRFLSLRRKPAKSTRLVEDPEQLEFWPVERPHRINGPVRSTASGASLLLEP